MDQRLIVLACFLVACGGEVVADEPARAPEQPSAPNDDDGATSSSESEAVTSPTAPRAPSAGSFRFVTYNVAGLPDIISSGTPSKTIPLISPKLNAYDVVAVQEAFDHFAALTSALTFEFRTRPSSAQLPKVYGDGLAVFARMTGSAGGFEAWRKCNGTLDQRNDCLAAKGFQWVTLRPAPGVEIDLYDLHMDAGESQGDIRARDEQTRQLVDHLASRPRSRALIVAGDTNMDADSETGFLELLRLGSLRDACRELGCPEPANIDRVMVKDGEGVRLTVGNWRRETTFTDAAGKPLSDHDPIAVDVSWTTR